MPRFATNPEGRIAHETLTHSFPHAASTAFGTGTPARGSCCGREKHHPWAVTTLGPGDVAVYLPGVRVLLRCEKAADKLETTVTDENGRFSLPSLERDKCSATANAEGFRGETKIVAATENSAVELSFRLEFLTVAERRDRP